MNMLSVLLQKGIDSSAVANAAVKQEQINYIELAIKGGWVMIPILLLSVVAVYIFVDRYFAIRKASKLDHAFMDRIKDYIHEGKIDAALNFCKDHPNVVPRMIEKGLQRLGRPLSDINTAIENVGRVEIAKLEKGIPFLATCAGGAPMLGFLGTVTGMVRAFFDMANAGNNIDIQLLSNGIYEAMVTTVAGLIVGIMAYFAYNFVVAKIQDTVNVLELKAMEFMDLLNEPVK